MADPRTLIEQLLDAAMANHDPRVAALAAMDERDAMAKVVEAARTGCPTSCVISSHRHIAECVIGQALAALDAVKEQTV